MDGKRHVVPGDSLGTEEEFTAGEGTFVDASGEIRALYPGTQEVSRDKTVSVRASVEVPQPLRRGDVVLARVEELHEPVALLQIQPGSADGKRQGPSDGFSVIHASRIKPGYVELVRDELRIGDIVRASVEDIRADGEIALSTKGPGLGVIEAFCSRCRGPLSLCGQKLQCCRCGQQERRHLSRDYVLSK
jgi:exosome complex component CSL4